ncbi:amino acid transporter [Fulvimarina endophytica]|uniref:Amino acid transporter n=2 Tax=Fulvimarina endophytica TaxID=2293836 RepID=A0A371X3J0_9HYPH|nr:amino acid transporter [Fulvimarina endophytica]
MIAFASGFGVGLTLILAIGAQNAFVLRQGIRGEHVAAICLTCALSDAILITFGVAGFRVLTDMAAWLEPVLLVGGAAFLLAYGARSFYSAATSSSALSPSGEIRTSLPAALGVCLALTWLNPHVYLDTVVFLGAVSTGFPGREAAFALGAITASFTFFFALGYGAILLRPVFARPSAWRVLDVAIGLLMWAIAAKLLAGAI